MEQQTKPGLIFEKIALVMNEIEAISKDRDNKQQGFKFRGIDDVYNTLHYVMAKHKIFTVPSIVGRNYADRTSKSGSAMFHRILTVQYRFFAKDGSFVDCVVDGEATDSGDKSTSKCLAIAHKYALLQVFCIPTSDDKDPDAESHDLEPPKGSNNGGPNITPKGSNNGPNAPQPPQQAWTPGVNEENYVRSLFQKSGWNGNTVKDACAKEFRKHFNQLNEDEYAKLLHLINTSIMGK